MKHKRGMKYKQISNIPKRNTKRFNFRSSHTLKIRFSKIPTKEGLITRSMALKSTYRGKRGKKEGKNYHKGFWKSNQRKQWWWLTSQTPTFILKQHWQSGRDGPQFCCSLALWIQHNISGVTNLKFFNYIHNTNRHVHENCYKLLDLKSS